MKKLFSLREYVREAPFFVMAGPCVLEEKWEALDIARNVKDICAKLGLPAIFKASFDKANRTSAKGGRGPGLKEGLNVLASVGREVGLPVMTDIHHPEQAVPAAEVCAILQVPAFLCRQTDIVQAAACAASVVAIKKGQFLSPWDTKHIVDKIRNVSPSAEVILTERGASFGYGNLVVDMRSFPVMKEWADHVVFDATHSLQLPGGGGTGRTTGQREFIPYLARAAMATGCVGGIFLEVHPEPARSPSDADNILPLHQLESLLSELIAIRQAITTKPRT
ncbi:MAG: 3-deoxy-8-phosphooctulonate synthase [Candidatus Riflebacteria bacterium]|nr:3-deoxy-8-phosphooctulonate synthase [Candidatus Riflebacteria bacterium]